MLVALSDARKMGAKAITLVGDGEPTLYPRFAEFTARVAQMGYELGLFTNGSWKDDSIADAIAANFRFIRFSVDAATLEKHKATHLTNDFDQVTENIGKIASRKSSALAVGVQFAVNEENIDDIISAAKLYGELGADYISYKPVYKNDLNDGHVENRVQPEKLKEALEKAKKYESSSFGVYWKNWQMESLIFEKDSLRGYDKCLAIWLSPYIDEDGRVEFCGNLKGRGFTIGNIYEKSFSEIWGSKEHLESVARINLEQCPRGCKLHGLNLKLAEIENLPKEKHGNFI
jgi:radical SAM protein with 4Fe4S-binding SPASM domain